MFKPGFFLILFLLSLTSFSLAQIASPVLEFPEAGVDDSSAYADYITRFYKDSRGNTLQISINKKTERIINLWADAANESIAFSVRDTAGYPVDISFGSINANLSEEGDTRFLQYALTSPSPNINIGLFLLGSMRIERDFRYQNRGELPLSTDTVFIQPELIELIENIQKLPASEQKKHLQALNANSIEELEQRLKPKVDYFKIPSRSAVAVKQISFDAENHLSLEISVTDDQIEMEISENVIHLHNKSGGPIFFHVKIGADSPALTPLTKDEIFNEEFLNFYEKRKREYYSLLGKSDLTETEKEVLLEFKRMQRQINSLELLSYQEKLMAGLPNFATYFGRDMMMSALMMKPIWNVSMFEYVIKSVLKKLDPNGNVSHEEGLGGQAIRENAQTYNSLLAEYFRSEDNNYKDSILTRAARILENIQRTTENYHMIDDDFQLPVLVAHYLSNGQITNYRKINFLRSVVGKRDSLTIMQLIIENLKYITDKTKNYVENPIVTNLISFVKNDEGYWQSASWRDSRAGYAFGRFAMDVNSIWAPKALESAKIILNFLKKNNLTIDKQGLTQEFQNSILVNYFESPDMLEDAIKEWKMAAKYFWTKIEYEDAAKKIEAKLNWLSDEEEKYWKGVLNDIEYPENIEFLTLSLNENGEKIKVENTDPATLLFLTDFTDKILQGKITGDSVLNLLGVFTLPYPAGLFVEGLGTLAANDTYASKQIWEAFKNDKYHSPYVVWGREVNLILIGLCKQILSGYNSIGKIKNEKLFSYIKELKNILNKIHTAVEESGLLHNELWTYKIKNGKLYPVRYETTSDIQLWNLTNLAVQYLLEKINSLKLQ